MSPVAWRRTTCRGGCAALCCSSRPPYGLSLAFVLLPAIVLSSPSSGAGAFPAEAAKQIGLAIGVGIGLGVAVAAAVNRLGDDEELERSSFLAMAVALGLLALGLTSFLGGTGVLAAFIAGVTASVRLEKRFSDELEDVQAGAERLIIVPVFVLFGAMIPWAQWEALGAEGLAFAAWAVLLRRPPAATLALVAAILPGVGLSFHLACSNFVACSG